MLVNIDTEFGWSHDELIPCQSLLVLISDAGTPTERGVQIPQDTSASIDTRLWKAFWIIGKVAQSLTKRPGILASKESRGFALRENTKILIIPCFAGVSGFPDEIPWTRIRSGVHDCSISRE